MAVMNRAAWAALLMAASSVLFCIPASAQVDFSGEWAVRIFEDQPERVPGPELGDYLGLPVNDAARMRADTWSASVFTLPEWQCRPHSEDYIWRGPSALKIWKEVDPVSRLTTAFHAEWLRSIDRAVYLDGRPHPPDYAAHTWAGFSTGKWDGDILTVSVTHLKEGYIRRNGMARSDLAQNTEHWIRHGDWFTVVTVVNDPVYLAEPFVRTTDYELDVHQQIPPYPCDVVSEIDRKEGVIPSIMPGKNTMLTEFSDRWGVSPEAARGGPETMYPEYRKKLKPGTAKNGLARPPNQAAR